MIVELSSPPFITPSSAGNFKFSERTFYVLWKLAKMCCLNRRSDVYPVNQGHMK